MAVRTCVIFNPAARGEKARRLRRHLDRIAGESTLKLTTAPGDARKLATEAVREGFEAVIAAGGDGTVNEVLNGLGDTPHGFESAALGVLPLGTVNVFARELSIPTNPVTAWEIIRRGKILSIDLPKVEFAHNGSTEFRYFAQMAGAGLDARAVELVAWELKKKVGPLAYVVAGLQALAGPPANITASGNQNSSQGGLVLVGNGRLYGGSFRIFPKADLKDGLLDVCVFPRVNWGTLLRCGPRLLLKGLLPVGATENFQTPRLTLSSPEPVPFELDGELAGRLPATITLERGRLRVIAP